ncbi:hypothetical protein GGF32_007017 [Allomyces javanicus]|nr:hypothetical protein GGF32_007017 [Allomyces javanicus]
MPQLGLRMSGRKGFQLLAARAGRIVAPPVLQVDQKALQDAVKTVLKKHKGAWPTAPEELAVLYAEMQATLDRLKKVRNVTAETLKLQEGTLGTLNELYEAEKNMQATAAAHIEERKEFQDWLNASIEASTGARGWLRPALIVGTGMVVGTVLGKVIISASTI